MSRRILLLAGAGATAVYVVSVILGGIIRPGFSHLSQAVSELIEIGAPNKNILNPLFLLYNLLTAGFGIGLYFYGSNGTDSRRIIVAASVVLVAEAVFGFVTVFFPQDVPGTPITPTGTVHILLAATSSLSPPCWQSCS